MSQNQLKLLKVSLGFLLICYSTFIFGQSISNLKSVLTVEAIIVDQVSLESLPYASIYNLKTNKGTISNQKGYFRLQKIQADDSLHISFIGYNALQVKVSDAFESDTIYMVPKAEEIDEIYVIADNSYLYNLIMATHEFHYDQYKLAKTYFQLETFCGQKQLELVECYYNGNFSGYNIKGLNYKNGRIALAPLNGRFFISTGSSNA